MLAHPQMVARGDAAGIARETGLITSARRLQKLALQLVNAARARELLAAHGVKNLQHRVRSTDGGRAPMEAVDALQAALPQGRSADAMGLLPVDTVRLPREEAEVTIEDQADVELPTHGRRRGRGR